jgi:hypothetical protein
MALDKMSKTQPSSAISPSSYATAETDYLRAQVQQWGQRLYVR